MTKRKRSKTYNTTTGPITVMEGITVTPKGNGIGLPAESSELIPEGAWLTDEQRRESEARIGAVAVNSGRAQIAPIFARAASLPAYLTPVGPLLGAIEGAVGLYNQYQNGDFQRAADIVSSDQGLWDKTKALAPIALETGLNGLMIIPGAKAASDASLMAVGRYGSGAVQNYARAKVLSNEIDKLGVVSPVLTEPISVERELYEPATKVIKSEPYAKVWRNGQGYNEATAYKLDTKPSYFEIVNDKEPGYHSVHFKTDDPRFNIDGRRVTTPQERQMLFNTVAQDFPEGELLSTHGDLTRGGERGLGRFQTNYYWIKVGDRTVKTKAGESLTIPILQKPYKPTVAPKDLAGNTRVRRARLIKRAEDAPEIGREPMKIIYDESVPLSKLGIQYGDLNSGDINVPDTYHPSEEAISRFGYNTTESYPAASYVWDNYKKAMNRRRAYLSNTPFKRFAWWNNANGFRLNNSVILGDTHTLPDGTSYFTPKHFAPTNLREGYQLIDKLGKGDQPVVFAITDDLQKMLQKTGDWFYAGQIPQPFNGHIVMKKVMVNRAFKPEMIDGIAQQYGLNLDYLKKQLIESRSLQQELSPTMTPLSELLTEDDLLKLKNSIK